MTLLMTSWVLSDIAQVICTLFFAVVDQHADDWDIDRSMAIYDLRRAPVFPQGRLLALRP